MELFFPTVKRTYTEKKTFYFPVLSVEIGLLYFL